MTMKYVSALENDTVFLSSNCKRNLPSLVAVSNIVYKYCKEPFILMSAVGDGGGSQKQTIVLISWVSVTVTVTRGRGSRSPEILRMSYVSGS